MNICSSLLRLITSAASEIRDISADALVHCGNTCLLCAKIVEMNNLSVSLCRLLHIYFKEFTLVLVAHTCYSECLERAAAEAANESEPRGNCRGHFKSGISRLDKGLKFFIHSCAALLL